MGCGCARKAGCPVNRDTPLGPLDAALLTFLDVLTPTFPGGVGFDCAGARVNSPVEVNIKLCFLTAGLGTFWGTLVGRLTAFIGVGCLRAPDGTAVMVAGDFIIVFTNVPRGQLPPGASTIRDCAGKRIGLATRGFNACCTTVCMTGLPLFTETGLKLTGVEEFGGNTARTTQPFCLS